MAHWLGSPHSGQTLADWGCMSTLKLIINGWAYLKMVASLVQIKLSLPPLLLSISHALCLNCEFLVSKLAGKTWRLALRFFAKMHKDCDGDWFFLAMVCPVYESINFISEQNSKLCKCSETPIPLYLTAFLEPSWFWVQWTGSVTMKQGIQFHCRRWQRDHSFFSDVIHHAKTIEGRLAIQAQIEKSKFEIWTSSFENSAKLASLLITK